MVLVYRSVKGAPLTSAEGDGNIHDLDDRITDVVDNPPEAVSIADPGFVVSGTQFTVLLTDSTTQGPFELPAVQLGRPAPWQPEFFYAVNDIVTRIGASYLVLFAHMSETEFDPGANDGMGNDYYGLLLSSFGAPSAPEEITADTFEPLAEDANKYFRCTNDDGCMVNIPSNADVEFEIGTELHFRQCTDGSSDNDGAVVLVADTGVNLNPIAGFESATGARGAVLTAKLIAEDEWDVFGLLREVSA